MPPWRRVLLAALLAAAAAFAVLSAGAPRLTLHNADVQITYPWPRAAAALASALAAAGFALVVKRTWARVLAGAFAVAAALAAAHLVLYRVRAGAEGIEARTLLGSRQLAWRSITQVEAAPGVLLIRGGAGERVRVDTTDFRAEDRATLDRTIARRLNSP